MLQTKMLESVSFCKKYAYVDLKQLAIINEKGSMCVCVCGGGGVPHTGC